MNETERFQDIVWPDGKIDAQVLEDENGQFYYHVYGAANETRYPTKEGAYRSLAAYLAGSLATAQRAHGWQPTSNPRLYPGSPFL